MAYLSSLWARHKRKLLVSLGVVGGGYALYKLYDAHRSRVVELEKQSEKAQKFDELIKAQSQAHFDNIQRVSDTATLPYAMSQLRFRISEDLDLLHLTDKLIQGKGQSSSLTPKEKLELWEKLKILSMFTRTASSLWSMTMICLYVRVQVNILGKHLYLEIARGSESSQSLDESDSLSSGQQDFLTTADYLSAYGIGRLLMNMENAATEVLKEKHLREPLTMDQLRETITQILDVFMSVGEPNNWISYLIPQNAVSYKQLTAMSSNGFDNTSMVMDISKLEQLMSETCAVLSSPGFKQIAEISLKSVVDVLVEDICTQSGGGAVPSWSSVVPLAKLLPSVAKMGLPLLESLPEVQLLYTLLYTNMPLN